MARLSIRSALVLPLLAVMGLAGCTSGSGVDVAFFQGGRLVGFEADASIPAGAATLFSNIQATGPVGASVFFADGTTVFGTVAGTVTASDGNSRTAVRVDPAYSPSGRSYFYALPASAGSALSVPFFPDAYAVAINQAGAN